MLKIYYKFYNNISLPEKKANTVTERSEQKDVNVFKHIHFEKMSTFKKEHREEMSHHLLYGAD